MSDKSARGQVHPAVSRVLFDAEALRARVAEMGREITRDYAGKTLSILTILEGGAVFMADLIRAIDLPLRVESIAVSSYYGQTRSSGEVTFRQNELPDLAGRDVLLVDDILDSGRTLTAILERVGRDCAPRSQRVCVLLEKACERACPIEASYCGFRIGDEFVVGYGLDYQGECRNLPYVGVLDQNVLS